MRTALIEHGMAILRTRGPEALTLRGVARAAGVSEAAPYRHFADRRELVGAIAEAGFQRLGAAMQGTVVPNGARDDSREGLKGFALGYINFAMANPALYRIMFGQELANTDDLPSLRETSRGVLGGVAGAITGLQQAGLIGPGDPWSFAVATWAMLHGLVMLSLDGVSSDVAPPMDVLVQDATRIMMFGMVGPPATK